MANRTIANGGGNWKTAGTWVENAVPTASDAVIATATSGNVTIDGTDCVCSTMILTNYVGTMSGNTGNKLTVTTTVTFASGMTISGGWTLQINDNATITSAGVTFTGSLIFDGGTFTLGDNWTVTGNVTANNSTQTLNSNTMYIGESLTATAGSTTIIAGTTTLVLNGTGTIATNSGTGSYIGNSVTINTAGTITIGANVNYRTGTLTYTAGTVVTTNSTLSIIGANANLNITGVTWANITIGQVTATLISNLTCLKLYNRTADLMTFAGNYNITTDDLVLGVYGSSRYFTFIAGTTLTVNNSIVMSSGNSNANIYSCYVVSSSAATAFNLVYNGTLANCKIFGAIFTDCDASGSAVPIYNWAGGTLTRTTNIYNVDGSSFPVVTDVKNTVSYAGGALTGTYAGGGSSSDVFGII